MAAGQKARRAVLLLAAWAAGVDTCVPVEGGTNCLGEEASEHTLLATKNTATQAETVQMKDNCDECGGRASVTATVSESAAIPSPALTQTKGTICENIPVNFVPDVSCAGHTTGLLPDEVSNIPGIDGVFRTNDFSSDRALYAESCLGYPKWGIPSLESQFGNAFFIWAERFTNDALCGSVRASSPTDDLDTKLGGLSYCREEVRGDEESDACKRFTGARDYQPNNLATCWWNAYGFSLALPSLRQEWARIMFTVLQADGLEQELPCSHVQALPAAAPFVAIHVRCGDIATHVEKRHFMVKPEWLRNFLPAVTEGVSHALIFGNRKYHSDPYSEGVCQSKFEEMQRYVKDITDVSVHVAPELPGQSGLVRDIRCMTQARELDITSFGSTFSAVASLLHQGCGTYLPYPSWDTGDIVINAHRLRENQHFFTFTEDMVWNYE